MERRNRHFFRKYPTYVKPSKSFGEGKKVEAFPPAPILEKGIWIQHWRVVKRKLTILLCGKKIDLR